MSSQSAHKLCDLIIVIKGEPSPAVKVFIENLTECGLQLEFAIGQTVNRNFMLITIPQKVLENYAQIFNVVELRREGRPSSKKVTSIYSSAQKLLVLTRLLETISFGTEERDFGLTRLIMTKMVETAYPLHDGYYDGDHECVRKKLWKQWAKKSFLLPNQPLDDIQQYFGWEIGFYFAWLQFFTKMLLPAAIIGLLVFVVSLVWEFRSDINYIKEVCEEHNMYICPICDTKTSCVFRRLSSYCLYAKWTYVFDNYFTICFAVGMSFWATLVLNLWHRKESVLKYKWDVELDEIEVFVRPAYRYRYKPPKILERCLKPILPKNFSFLNISVAVTTTICLLIGLAAGSLAIVAYKLPLTSFFTVTNMHEELLLIIQGALVRVVFIYIFDQIYQKISLFLTDLENPKYQKSYNKSALYKRFLLSFANNFSFLFYIAFGKGRFFATPLAANKSFLKKDTCQPLTCILTLCFQLGLLMLFKRFLWNIIFLIYIELRAIYRNKTGRNREFLPAYEEEYNLRKVRGDFFMHNFCESAVEYGFVTFFVAAYPLAPLIALLNNIVLIRLNSVILITRKRRPYPKMVCGIAEWNGVLLGLTYLSTATNAFVTAFTSDFIWRQLYSSRYDLSLKGYVNSTLASFAIKDSPIYSKLKTDVKVCFYNGFRNPHHAGDKYEHSSDMWLSLSWKFIHVFIFEHIILACNAMLKYWIPKIPFSIKEQKTIDRYIANSAKWERMTEKEKEAKKREYFKFSLDFFRVIIINWKTIVMDTTG